MELENLANQLETLANHAQKISLDPSSYGDSWLAMLGIAKWQDVKAAGIRSPTRIFDSMRAYAEIWRDTATEFGVLLRTHPPHEKRQMIDCLLLEVWRSTGKYHDKELARLLSNAFEAVGSTKYFTTDQVKKHRQKHVMTSIKSLEKPSHIGV